jgi:hypothetical protein
MDLLCSSIPNGTKIFVVAEGIDCENSAKLVKYVLEHVDSEVRPWLTKHGPADRIQDIERLLSFLRQKVASLPKAETGGLLA